MRRRQFLKTIAVGSASALGHSAFTRAQSPPAPRQKALIAITLDLEMARNFPHWEDTHWDYEKGNLQPEMKNYALAAARLVKSYGGRIHFFLVCRALEQPDVDWLKDLIRDGHPIGSHTYDHVYLLASKPEEVQYRFQRAPWLLEGKTVPEVLRENLRLATAAMKSRLGIAPAGFRAPGGFADGLAGRADIQNLLLESGFKWASTKYPAHPNNEPGQTPTPDLFDAIVNAQAAAKPFTYPSGLLEVPMSPISDIGAFRNGRWKLEHFLESTRRNVQWAIEHAAAFDFLSHPACLVAMDPEMQVIKLICELVRNAGDKAELVTLEQIANRANAR